MTAPVNLGSFVLSYSNIVLASLLIVPSDFIFFSLTAPWETRSVSTSASLPPPDLALPRRGLSTQPAHADNLVGVPELRDGDTLKFVSVTTGLVHKGVEILDSSDGPAPSVSNSVVHSRSHCYASCIGRCLGLFRFDRLLACDIDKGHHRLAR